MLQCQNCGQTNNYGSNFCRFCGTRMVMPQNAQPVDTEQSQPRPYMWKTDEFQVRNNQARNTQEIKQVQQMLPPNTINPRIPQAPGYQQQPPQQYQPQQYQQQQMFQPGYGYRCPRCGTQQAPILTKKISAAGWVTFAVLMVFFFPLFWIGLLIKEDVRVCSICGMRIG